MPALMLSVAAGELSGRIAGRLGGLPPVVPASVVWQRGQQRVLLHIDSLHLVLVDGWLVCGIDLETDPTGRQNLQLVYYLGTAADGDSVQAAAVVNAVTAPAAQIAGTWGADLERVIWDAVLDIIEGTIFFAGSRNPGQTLQFLGFNGTNGAIEVYVAVGEA